MNHNMYKAEIEKDFESILVKGEWAEEEVEMMHYLSTILLYLNYKEDKAKDMHKLADSYPRKNKEVE